jgi:membrane-associated phospholipid phosphatase
MVIFAIATMVSPYFKDWWKVLLWALAAAVCLSRVYLGAHFPLDVAAGAGLGMFIGGVLNLVFGVPATARVTPAPVDHRDFAYTARRDLVNAGPKSPALAARDVYACCCQERWG